jgi:Tol biopolymer transport system component
MRMVAHAPCEYGYDCFASPEWSPDGNAIAYSSGGANKAVWTVQLGGGTPTMLSDGEANATNPTFSPDGRMVAWFESEDAFGYGPPTAGSIVVAGADGSNVRVLTGAARVAWSTPRWSPDARTVIVPLLVEGADVPYELGVFPVEGGAPGLLPLDGAVDGDLSWQRRP